MLSQISPCGAHVQPVRFSSTLPSQSSSRLLQISVCGVITHAPPWHVPGSLTPAALATVHASPGFLPWHAVTPASQNRPVPSALQTLLPFPRPTPGRPLLHELFFPGK